MSSRPGGTPSPATARRPDGFEAPPDRERRNAYYRWLIHLGLPLGVSLLLHVLLFALLSLKTWEVHARPAFEVGEYEAGIVASPEDQLDQAFSWGEQVYLEAPEVVPLEEWSLTDLSRIEPVSLADLEQAGTGSAAGPDLGPGDGALGIGAGRLNLLGTGGGAGEVGAGGFGSGLGGRGRLGQAGLWNVRVAANKIAYVVDFSGSIIVAVDDLKRELKRSVGRLKPAQSFAVIIFYSEGTGSQERFKSEAFAPQLQPATEQVRREFFTWLDRQTPRGATEPLQSMRRALALGPQVVFFFSDGYFDDSVVEAITRANREHQAKIICFVFDEILLQDTSRLPRETDGARRLRQIAEQNGGQVKIVTGADLQP